MALATEVTLETLSSLYATVYMRAWYRLMGAKIGKDSEISTNLAGRYDLVEIGDKCFIADEVILGDEEVRRGWMRLEKLKTGSRVFIGNDGVLPPGSIIPDGALIGIKSKPPANDQISPGDTWFGSPPIKLPVRQKFDGGGSTWTYEAPRWKKFARAGVRGGPYFAADHAVHHLRHLGDRMVRPGHAGRRLWHGVLDVRRLLDDDRGPDDPHCASA